MIDLQRTIEVRTFDVEATVAVGRDRPEFLAVARLAADLGPISGRDISNELLGLPEPLGWRVLERALALSLLEREGNRGPARLSAAGRKMLDLGTVLVEEEGIWRFFCVQDPLIDNPLLHVERLKTDNARVERDQLYQKGRRERPEGREPPKLLSQLEKQLLISVADSRGFEVRELGQQGKAGPDGSLRLSLRWSKGSEPYLSLRGQLPSAQAIDVDSQLTQSTVLQEFSYDEVWAMLVAQAMEVPEEQLFAWMERAGLPVLPTTMDPWPADVRRTFSASVDVPAFSDEDFGSFDESRLEQVLLVAESDRAARYWAQWLLWNRIEKYVVPSDIEKLRTEVARKFPFHQPPLSTPSELLLRAQTTPREPSSRFLLAPADLGLWS